MTDPHPGPTNQGLTPGFIDPVMYGGRTFRAILEAMSRPGTIVHVPGPIHPPQPMDAAMTAVCLTLLDLDSPVWVPSEFSSQARNYLRFHCGCPLVLNPDQAAFALILDEIRMPDLSVFSKGSAEYPDRSTTLIIRVAGLAQAPGFRLTSPGIETSADLRVDGLSEKFPDWWQSNRELFPLGNDVILVSADRAACLPRSVRIEVC